MKKFSTGMFITDFFIIIKEKVSGKICLYVFSTVL